MILNYNAGGKIKILFVGTNQSVIFQRWVEWYIKKGYKVGIIGKVKNYQESALFYDISYPKGNISQKISPFGFIIQLIKIRQAIKDFNPDIIHCHQIFLYGIMINLLGFHPNVISVWGSDILLKTKESLFIKLLTKYAISKCNLITVESSHVAKECLKYGIDENKIKFIQFGIDPSKLRNTANVDFTMPLNSKTIIIFPRGLDKLYNAEVLINSMPHVLKIFPEALFIFKYYIHENHDTIIKNLLLNLDKLGINKHNYLFIGELSYPQLLKLYSLSKVFISIPSSDSISISLIEGILMGAVPILSDIPANREIMKEKDELIVPIDPLKLAEAIINVLSNYYIITQKLNTFKVDLLEKFDQERNMLLVEEIYKKIT